MATQKSGPPRFNYSSPGETKPGTNASGSQSSAGRWLAQHRPSFLHKYESDVFQHAAPTSPNSNRWRTGAMILLMGVVTVIVIIMILILLAYWVSLVPQAGAKLPANPALAAGLPFTFRTLRSTTPPFAYSNVSLAETPIVPTISFVTVTPAATSSNVTPTHWLTSTTEPAMLLATLTAERSSSASTTPSVPQVASSGNTTTHSNPITIAASLIIFGVGFVIGSLSTAVILLLASLRETSAERKTRQGRRSRTRENPTSKQTSPSGDRLESPPDTPTQASTSPTDTDFMPLTEGFVAVATRSKGRSEKDNDDAGLSDSQPWYRLMAVADGVGMAAHSSIASQAVVRIFQEHIQRLNLRDRFSNMGETANFYQAACEGIGQALTAEGFLANSGATTFIGVVEYPEYYLLTYLADGSVYWGTQCQDGFNISLTSLLLTSASPDVPPQMSANGPSEEHKVLTTSKLQNEGFIWVIATDGMNDFERYLEDRTLVRGASAVEHLVREIWQTFQASPAQFTTESIEAVLKRWIQRCQTTDDATVAVLISGEMYANWQRLAQNPDPRKPISISEQRRPFSNDDQAAKISTSRDQ